MSEVIRHILPMIIPLSNLGEKEFKRGRFDETLCKLINKKGEIQMRKLKWSIVILFILITLISCTSQKTVKELKFNKPSLSMEVGTSDTLILSFSPEDATNPDIEWLSSDEKIATVDNTGLVKASSIGLATITAKTKNGRVSTTSEVTVIAKSVKGIKLNKDSARNLCVSNILKISNDFN